MRNPPPSADLIVGAAAIRMHRVLSHTPHAFCQSVHGEISGCEHKILRLTGVLFAAVRLNSGSMRPNRH